MKIIAIFTQKRNIRTIQKYVSDLNNPQNIEKPLKTNQVLMTRHFGRFSHFCL